MIESDLKNVNLYKVLNDYVIHFVMQHEKMSTLILEKLIYERDEEIFKYYGITKVHLKKIQDMIQRSDGFVRMLIWG